MIKLAFAIAFLVVFGIVAYAVVVLLTNNKNQLTKTKKKNGKLK